MGSWQSQQERRNACGGLRNRDNGKSKEDLFARLVEWYRCIVYQFNKGVGG
jgi:hypothetical protein